MKTKRCWHFWRQMWWSPMGEILCKPCLLFNLSLTCNVKHQDGWTEFEEIPPPRTGDART